MNVNTCCQENETNIPQQLHYMVLDLVLDLDPGLGLDLDLNLNLNLHESKSKSRTRSATIHPQHLIPIPIHGTLSTRSHPHPHLRNAVHPSHPSSCRAKTDRIIFTSTDTERDWPVVGLWLWLWLWLQAMSYLPYVICMALNLTGRGGCSEVCGLGLGWVWDGCVS